uniref:Uncharacterized protein n=1 Tax=Cyprinus carpio TaxID=7962 RepID=A0A8C1MP40_CYPCA
SDHPLETLALGLSNLSMFPFFDTAHYIISVMKPVTCAASRFTLLLSSTLLKYLEGEWDSTRPRV